jgi:hypothetical protein
MTKGPGNVTAAGGGGPGAGAVTGEPCNGLPRGGPLTEPAAAIRAVLDGDGEFAALAVLGLALRWAAAALDGDATATTGGAFRAVAEADRALVAAPGFFAALAVLVSQGEPAPEVAADLRRYAEQAAELDRATAPMRDRLTELLRAEDRLRAEAARKEELVARVGELERIERLAAHIADLRAQHAVLMERTAAVTAVATDAEAELGAAAGTLIALSEDALAAITERTRVLLRAAAERDQSLKARLAEHREAASRAAADAEHAGTELAAAEAESARALADLDAARGEATRRLTALRRHQRANRDVADALAGRPLQATTKPPAQADPLATALRALTEVETRLAEIDTQLGAALSAGKD